MLFMWHFEPCRMNELEVTLLKLAMVYDYKLQAIRSKAREGLSRTFCNRALKSISIVSGSNAY